MKATYDQKTLNKVYSLIKRKEKKLVDLHSIFGREANRYQKLKDSENYEKAIEMCNAFDLAKQELELLERAIKREFKGKTKKQKTYDTSSKTRRKV